MSIYLPDGCTQDEIDRYAGGYDDEPPEDEYGDCTPDDWSLFATEPAL